jgi:hypothetical protein
MVVVLVWGPEVVVVEVVCGPEVNVVEVDEEATGRPCSSSPLFSIFPAIIAALSRGKS